MDGWSDVGDGTTDISLAGPGSRAGWATLVVEPHREPVRVLSTLVVWVQLSEQALAALTGGVPVPTFVRRRGLGRVRKNFATPLRPPADQVWIQSVDGDAVLVVRRDGPGPEHAFVLLGPLAPGTRQVAAIAGSLQVILVGDDDFLPLAGWQHLRRLVADHRAWGGLVDCTADSWFADGCRTDG